MGPDFSTEESFGQMVVAAVAVLVVIAAAIGLVVLFATRAA